MRRRLATLALVGAVLSLTGCKWVYVGDSVLWGAGHTLDTAREDDRLQPIIGRGPDSPGFGTTSLRQVIRIEIANVDPGGWLVVQEAGDHVIDAAFVQWVVNTVPDDICLGWVTPHDWDHRDVSADVAAIEAGIVGQPCHRVIPWHDVDTTNLTIDSIHLNEDGYRVFTDLILENT